MLVYLDDAAVNRLTQSLKPASVNKLYKLFSDEVGRLKINIHLSLKELKEDKLHEYAHALKGCAGNYGALNLARLAQDLEKSKIHANNTKKLVEQVSLQCEEAQKEALSIANNYKN